MAGFFVVKDIPARRVVEYRRVVSHDGTAVFIDDESVLGAPVDSMPHHDKTGLSTGSRGGLYEVPYLADAGGVYFYKNLKDAKPGDTLKVEAKAGVKPYAYEWYKDDKQVVNIPLRQDSLVALTSGRFWCVVTDAAGEQAVSTVAKVE